MSYHFTKIKDANFQKGPTYLDKESYQQSLYDFNGDGPYGLLMRHTQKYI